LGQRHGKVSSVFVAGPKGNAIRMAAEPGGRAFLIGVRVYLPEPENPNGT